MSFFSIIQMQDLLFILMIFVPTWIALSVAGRLGVRNIFGLLGIAALVGFALQGIPALFVPGDTFYWFLESGLQGMFVSVPCAAFILAIAGVSQRSDRRRANLRLLAVGIPIIIVLSMYMAAPVQFTQVLLTLNPFMTQSEKYVALANKAAVRPGKRPFPDPEALPFTEIKGALYGVSSVPFLEKAHALEPQNPDITYRLAHAYRYTHQPDKSRQFFEKTLALNPDLNKLPGIYEMIVEKSYGTWLKAYKHSDPKERLYVNLFMDACEKARIHHSRGEYWKNTTFVDYYLALYYEERGELEMAIQTLGQAACRGNYNDLYCEELGHVIGKQEQLKYANNQRGVQ